MRLQIPTRVKPAGGMPGATTVEPDEGEVRGTTVPAALLLTLYLVGTGRWGSYVSLPSIPFFIGDAVLGLAFVQLTRALTGGRATVRTVATAPLVLHLTLCLVGWAALRAVLQGQADLVFLRDLAPYAYAIVVLPAFLLPASREERWKVAVYSVLTAHVVWVVGLPLLPGFPWSLPVIGADAVVLVARPDFDSAVCGVAVAFALRELLSLRRGRLGRATALVGFLAANAYATAILETRAGLLAGILATSAVLATHRFASFARTPRWRTALLATAVIAAAIGAALLTPTGGRLVEGLDTSSSQARGTVDVRQAVWDKVGDFVFRSPGRTAMGVGFGRNFIDESGARAALEGDTFINVRSPHNYLVGTLARLGVFGALLAGLILLIGLQMALAALRSQTAGPVTVLAALLCVALPVTAFLGVVLESPFGALPYFWAIGQIAFAQAARADARTTGPRERRAL